MGSHHSDLKKIKFLTPWAIGLVIPRGKTLGLNLKKTRILSKMSVLKAYSGIICLQTDSNKHQCISKLLDSKQAARSKIKISLQQIGLPFFFKSNSLGGN